MGEYSGEVNINKALPKLNFYSEQRLAAIRSGPSNYNYLGCTGIPISLFLEVIDFLPYGHEVRVMISHLFLTGCRLCELDIMAEESKDCYLKGTRIFWKPGKGQKGWRTAELSVSYLRELMYYQETHKTEQNKLFGISAETLRRYFNRDVRPFLSEKWNLPTDKPDCKSPIDTFKFMLKGFRKTYATLIFAKAAKKHNDDYSFALTYTCKVMLHSSERITANHYVNEIEPLEIDKWLGWTPCQILALANQRHLQDFKTDDFERKLISENQQMRIHDWMGLEK